MVRASATLRRGIASGHPETVGLPFLPKRCRRARTRRRKKLTRIFATVETCQINNLLVLLFCLLGTASGISQDHRHPRVEIVGEVRAKVPFVVRIAAAEKLITFCQRLNVSIPTPSGREDAPRPVKVEFLSGRRWFVDRSNLPDIGVAFSAVSLEPHEHRDFRLILELPGDYRFTLRYREGDEATTCPDPQKRQKKVVSQIIHVRE